LAIQATTSNPGSCGRYHFDHQNNADNRFVQQSIRVAYVDLLALNEMITLQNLDGIQPAGEYVVLLDDELIEGLSGPAYRRVATLFKRRLCPPRSG
jgi:hypothetical protein